MTPSDRPDAKYLPRRCPFLNRGVWAILARQSTDGWRVVNCLDKDAACFTHSCAFTTDGGDWPFEPVSVQETE